MHSWASVNVVIDATIFRRCRSDLLKSSFDSLKLASSHTNRKFCKTRRTGRGSAGFLSRVFAVLVLPTEAAAAPLVDDDTTDEFFDLVVVADDDTDEVELLALGVDFFLSIFLEAEDDVF